MKKTACIGIMLLLSWLPLNSIAEGFSIIRAQTILIDKVYRLSADIDYELSNQVLDALHNGVAITLAIDMSIYHERNYWWDELIASLKQAYQIRYRALTKQYMVNNLNTGSIDYFSRIEQVTEKLGIVDSFPLIDSKLINEKRKHYTLVRTRIDLESLPVPLRLRAYINSSWNLKSAWFLCPM